MGAWGPGIFSDDDACDIREDVRDLLADGHTAIEIEQRIWRNIHRLGRTRTGPPSRASHLR